MKCKYFCIDSICNLCYPIILAWRQAVDNFIAKILPIRQNKCSLDFYAIKCIKIIVWTILKIYVRIFIQCNKYKMSEFSDKFRKLSAFIALISLHFSELKRKGVKRVFFYIPQVYPPRRCWKNFSKFFFIFYGKFWFWIWFLKNFID